MKPTYGAFVKPRLGEVAAWARGGRTDAEIAGLLGISPTTLRRYRAQNGELKQVFIDAKQAFSFRPWLGEGGTPYPLPTQDPARHWPKTPKQDGFGDAEGAARSARFPSAASKAAYARNRKKIIGMGDVCAICGGPVDKSLPAYHPMSAEADHIIPVGKGGDPVAIENLQLVHRACNRAKSDKLPGERARESDGGLDPAGWFAW